MVQYKRRNALVQPSQHQVVAQTQLEVLALISGARQALESTTSIHEVRDLRDRAEAIRAYQKQRGDSLEIQNEAAELKIRAERRLGELLRETPKNEGGRPSENSRHDVTGSTPSTLREQGIDRKQSERWQKIASVPVETFEAHVRDTKGSDQELTSASVLRIAAGQEREERRARCAEPGPIEGRYRVIYADPPWEYSGWMGHDREGQSAHYSPMTIDQLCALGEQVQAIIEENAALFLWCPSPLLMEVAPPVIKAWGFTYRTNFCWDKLKHNFGNYHTSQHEMLLLCTRGSCLPDAIHWEKSVVQIERTAHSEKPGHFREMIDRMYPEGNRIELFARRQPPCHWQAWGDQLPTSPAA